MQTFGIPDFATPRTRKLAEALNARIEANNAALADAQRQHSEVLADQKADRADAIAADLDEILTCPIPNDDVNAADPKVTQAARDLRKATVLFLRQEIGILRDVPPVEAAIAADRADALRAVEAELADAIAKVKAGLVKLGFGRFLELKPQVSYSVLGSWGPPARDPVTEFIYLSVEIETLEAKRQAILADVSGVPNGDRFIYSSGPRVDLEARRQAILANRAAPGRQRCDCSGRDKATRSVGRGRHSPALRRAQGLSRPGHPEHCAEPAVAADR